VTHLELKINGMHCAGCAAGIEKSLNRLEGVQQSQVNFAMGTASVDYEDESLSEQEILSKVVELGYEPEKTKGLKVSEDAAYREAQRNFFWALLFTLPVIAISMIQMLTSPPAINRNLAGILLFLLTAPVLFYAGRNIFSDALNQTRHFRANMNTLIALGSLTAFVFSAFVIFDRLFTNSFAGGEYYFETAAMIVTLILLGRFLESRAKGRARDAINALMRLRPERATAIIDGEEIEIDVTDVKKDMVLIVKPGEKIPADGEIIEGEISVNEAMITGEALPVDKSPGDKVFGGAVNGNNLFRMKVTGAGEDSFLSGIIRLVAQAQNRKAPVQRLADKIAGIFVPIVLLIALTTFLVWYFVGAEWGLLLKTTVAVLIIACPCALGLATPTAILAGTGRAARMGVYIRGGDILENTVKAGHVIFDKTGTLTLGEFKVYGMKALDEDKEEEILELAAAVESGSNHPLAEAIVKKAKAMNLKTRAPRNLEEFPGFGLKAEIEGRQVVVGSEATMKKEGIDVEQFAEAADAEMAMGRTIVYVAAEGAALGFLMLADQIKEEAVEVIDKLEKGGRTAVILTGDNYKTAKGVASHLGVGKFEAQVKPDQKATIVEAFRRAGHNVMMVGDGINDAPALAAANVGVALGSGTDVAIESADIILVKDDLRGVLETLDISRLTYRTIKQNLFWAFFYNIVAIPLAAGVFYPVFGWTLSPIIAAAAMSFSSLFVVTNSLRLLQVKRSSE